MKWRQKKRIPTRRRLTMRWMAALLLLILVSHALGVYCLTPERVLRSLEREQNTGDTVFLAETDVPDDEGNSRLRLSGGEDAVILARYAWSWKHGWYTNLAKYAERRQEKPFSAAVCRIRSDYDPDRQQTTDTYCVFGCVEDPGVTELVVQFHALEGGFDQTVRLTAADWILDGTGNRFFLCVLLPETGNWRRGCSVTGYFADGASTGTLELMGAEPRWE